MQFKLLLQQCLSTGVFRGRVPFAYVQLDQLFGLVLLGGLAAGEVSRRLFALPRTTGYVLFGLLVGQSGLNCR